ncbi:hypothetical protein RJ55_03563 [Drechmeria coniospora]|nr:hypothetical protein RJ55_03563 [Drechmeria coniospora]
MQASSTVPPATPPPSLMRCAMSHEQPLALAPYTTAMLQRHPNRDVPSGHAGPVIMCYQLVELYAACRCLYYQHAIDRCASYGRPGHGVQPRTIYVGYACSLHTSRSAQHAPPHSYADSGYHSGRSTHKNDH